MNYEEHANRAICLLLKRLVAGGYVRKARQAELLDRANNLKAGRGFVTDVELRDPKQVERSRNLQAGRGYLTDQELQDKHEEELKELIG